MDMSLSSSTFSVTRNRKSDRQELRKKDSEDSSNFDDSWSILEDSDYFESINYGILGKGSRSAIFMFIIITDF